MTKRIFWSIFSVAIVGVALCIAAATGVLSDKTLYLLSALLLALSALLAYLLARSIVRPINRIDPEKPAQPGGYPEISPLLQKITRQNRLINLQMSDLRRRQKEFRTMTDNMAEGVVLVDQKSVILSYNASAMRLMESINDDEISLKIFNEGLQKALAGKHSETSIAVNGRVYQILSNPVEADGKITGAVMLSLDITEKAEREAMRHDFSSNVSHELKTPLTSIYGMSELLARGMVKSEDVESFGKSIHDESGRLITLINDIIRLSQLDDNSFEGEKTDVDLYELAKDVTERLRPVAAERGISVTLSGSSAAVNGIPSILDEMIYNTVDNAIKYNIENGCVTVSAAMIGGHAVLSVSDTGIGIPQEHIDRVFERFYRVDKSHSKEIGGTGLGLSIVKHGASCHDAEVSIKSRVGRGTVVTVTF